MNICKYIIYLYKCIFDAFILIIPTQLFKTSALIAIPTLKYNRLYPLTTRTEALWNGKYMYNGQFKLR